MQNETEPSIIIITLDVFKVSYSGGQRQQGGAMAQRVELPSHGPRVPSTASVRLCD